MVIHMTFNHFNDGSNPSDPKDICGYRLMVGSSTSNRKVLVQIQLSVFKY